MQEDLNLIRKLDGAKMGNNQIKLAMAWKKKVVQSYSQTEGLS